MSDKDTVYRQDAIDAINAYLGLSAVSRTIQNMTSIQEILENLPSAEQEIIRCKDCKHYRSYAGIIDGYCDMAEWYGRFQNPNDFCSRAKRRIDE